MRQELINELKERADLTEEQARRAVEVFEDFLKQKAEDQGGFRGLFTGATGFFRDRD